MDPNLPAVLLMGGGEGMGPVKKTAMELVQSLFDKHLNKPIGQLIVICGRNRSLASTLESMDWKIPVKVISYLSLILENYLFKKLFSNCILIIGKRI
jgi:1,2-diacylglycerol 3-beta-galactosyltransferase